MKKLLVVTFVLALLVSCGELIDDGDGLTFWAQNANGQFYSLKANMLADNSLCEVWVERGSGVDQATAAAIASKYSNNVYSRITDAFSKSIFLTDYGKSFPSTVELAHFIVEELTGKKNSKLTILLLDIKDGYKTKGDAYVAGFFYPMDFLPNTQAIQQGVRSNERTMLYMDVYPGLSDLDEFYGTIAHELQHMMNFAVYFITEKTSLTDVWINEGLSSAAEYVYGGHNQQRIDWFNADLTNLIRKGNNFFVWGNREGTGANEHPNAVLDDYSTVYLFFQWLRLKSGGGNNVYKEIVFSDEYNHQAVVDAIGYSDWPKLLEDWLKANYYRSAPNGYDSTLNGQLHQIKYAPGGSTTLDLYPGEAVYSVASPYTVPSKSGYINYLGLQSGGATVNSGNSVTGALLTYNENTSLIGSTAPGTITGVANIVASRFSMPDSLRGPYAISIGDMSRRRGINSRALDLSLVENSSKLLKGVLIEE